MNTEEYFMRLALREAEKGFKKDEVPVGAVLVKDGKVLSKSFNKKETKQMATRHAEIIAIEKASKKLKNWNLTGCEIYITKEPCLMCYGAILSSRIKKICFGAFDKKYGLEVSKYKEVNEKGFNHSCEVKGGILEKECSAILSKFFKVKRV